MNASAGNAAASQHALVREQLTRDALVRAARVLGQVPFGHLARAHAITRAGQRLHESTFRFTRERPPWLLGEVGPEPSGGLSIRCPLVEMHTGN